jgi:hypothetical protein
VSAVTGLLAAIMPNPTPVEEFRLKHGRKYGDEALVAIVLVCLLRTS